jgi:hypothetical protein
MLTLEEQRAEFAKRRFLATPLSGLIAWTVVAIGGALLPPTPRSLLLFGATGSIVYLAVFLSKFTGENFLDKKRPKNAFDGLFFYCIASSALIFGIAIPFFLIDRSSLPLTVGVLTGTMWVPFSWIIQRWIGVIHAVVRTILIVSAWYLWPSQRFVVIPLIIVSVYAATILALEKRWKANRVLLGAG